MPRSSIAPRPLRFVVGWLRDQATPRSWIRKLAACLAAGLSAGSCLFAQRRRRAAQQRGHADIGDDAVIADHDRRRQHVAKVAADAEVAVIAITGKPARP